MNLQRLKIDVRLCTNSFDKTKALILFSLDFDISNMYK